MRIGKELQSMQVLNRHQDWPQKIVWWIPEHPMLAKKTFQLPTKFEASTWKGKAAVLGEAVSSSCTSRT
ncbi:hypothetical protein VNO77_13693 [Canavalia gladiata]|uniref:Uncharacterized protein n=1 Tax=Canavalia gladiata TaxID=3824 RepID=A0AAN9QQN2_CANGL